MKKLVGKDLFEGLVKITPIINTLYAQDVSFVVTDREKFIAVQPGETLNTGVNIGDPLKKESPIYQVMVNKKPDVGIVPKEVFGIAFKAISIPIFDEEDNVIGAVSSAISLDSEMQVQEIIEQFSAAFEQVNTTIQDFTQGSQTLSSIGEKLSTASDQTKENVKKTDDIIQMIKEIADQTKLLGLNAAIEAARAGENGRGFAVVAEEIRRLSQQSNDSAKEVKYILDEMNASVSLISEQSEETSAVSQQQSAATQEIAASMEQLCAQLESLNQLVKQF